MSYDLKELSLGISMKMGCFGATLGRNGKALFVNGHLLPRCGNQVDIKLVRDADKVDKYIGQLQTHLMLLFIGQLMTLFLGKPLKMLNQFRSLGNERH